MLRVWQHTRAVKRVLNILPDYWVIRELTERDYGIDLIVEIFEQSGTDANGHTSFDSTGAIFHIQVKGTDSPLSQKSDGTIHYSVNKKALSYAESFSTHFLLFCVDVSSPDAKSYFVWMQRYIRDVLDAEKVNWRSGKQDSFTVRIPVHNDVSEQFKKIEKIASRPKFIQELVGFKESYFHLSSQLDAASRGQLKINKKTLEHMRLLARQIRNLTTIFTYNDCCIDKSSAEDLLSFVEALNVSSVGDVFKGWPHKKNFDLLEKALEGISDIEGFIADNDSETVY